MPSTETLTRALLPMADDPKEPPTKTVRIAATTATKLQTIKALKDQMGQQFNSVQFLNGMVAEEVDRVYEDTVREFTEFQKKGKKK